MEQRAKKTVFFDIDTQYDFMAPAGKLSVPHAAAIIPNLKKITGLADRYAIPVISSLDWHTAADPEFKRFPAHCVRNTPGARKIPETIAASTRQIFVRKSDIDVFSNPVMKKLISRYSDVYVYGVATDYCVTSACIGARRLGKRVYLIKDAVKAITAAGKKAAVAVLRKHGVMFITTKGLKRRVVL